jgi:hypothetical protein
LHGKRRVFEGRKLPLRDQLQPSKNSDKVSDSFYVIQGPAGAVATRRPATESSRQADEVVLSHHRDRPSRHVRALRLHAGGIAHRRSDHGAFSGRAKRFAARPRLRAGDGLLEASAVYRAVNRLTVTQAIESRKNGMARLALRLLAILFVRQCIVSPSVCRQDRS